MFSTLLFQLLAMNRIVGIKAQDKVLRISSTTTEHYNLIKRRITRGLFSTFYRHQTQNISEGLFEYTFSAYTKDTYFYLHQSQIFLTCLF